MPSIEGPFLSVNVRHPNSTPLQNLETITKPLEEALATIPGVQQSRSSASTNDGRVNLNFDWSQDVGMVRNEVRDKVDQIRDELPENVERIGIWNWNTEQQPILYGSFSSERNLRQSATFWTSRSRSPWSACRAWLR